MKYTLALITVLLLVPLAAQAAVNVVNGDFSDLTGLTQGQNGWHAGLPKGWRGSAYTYAVHAKRGASRPGVGTGQWPPIRTPESCSMIRGSSDVTS